MSFQQSFAGFAGYFWNNDVHAEATLSLGAALRRGEAVHARHRQPGDYASSQNRPGSVSFYRMRLVCKTFVVATYLSSC